MTNDEKIELAESLGLIFAGIDDDGDLTFLGNDQSWSAYETKRDAYDI